MDDRYWLSGDLLDSEPDPMLCNLYFFKWEKQCINDRGEIIDAQEICKGINQMIRNIQDSYSKMYIDHYPPLLEHILRKKADEDSKKARIKHEIETMERVAGIENLNRFLNSDIGQRACRSFLKENKIIVQCISIYKHNSQKLTSQSTSST